MAGVEDLVNLTNAIGAIRGSSQTKRTSGGTTTRTTGQDVSQEGIDEIVRRILAGPGGVQEIGGSARRAGVYDSTTEDMLLGDLYSRAAVQGELARTPTTETTTTPAQVTTLETPGIGIGPVAGALAGAQALGGITRAVSGGGIGDAISGLFGGGAGGGAGAAIPGGFMSAIGAAPGLGVSGGLSTGAINAASSVAGGAGGALTSAVPGVGSFLGGLAGGRDAINPVGIGSALATGFALGGPVGAGIAGIGQVLGGIVGGSDGTVICTALMERGLLDRALYEEGLSYLYTLPEDTRNGYHYWAVGVAERIRNGSRFWTAICLPPARSRTSLLAAQGTLIDHLRHPLGTLTKYMGEPMCYVLGKVIRLKLGKAQGA